MDRKDFYSAFFVGEITFLPPSIKEIIDRLFDGLEVLRQSSATKNAALVEKLYDDIRHDAVKITIRGGSEAETCDHFLPAIEILALTSPVLRLPEAWEKPPTELAAVVLAKYDYYFGAQPDAAGPLGVSAARVAPK